MISGIGAEVVKQQSKNEQTKRGKYYLFGVFFDGTGNNMTNNHTKQLTIADQYLTFKQPTGSYQLEEKYDNGDGDDYSNIALLQACYQGMSQEKIDNIAATKDVKIYNIYSEGPGTTYDVGVNSPTGYNVGSGTGTGQAGVVVLFANVVKRINNLLGTGDLSDAEVHFLVFGFSRGAAIARMFSTFMLEREIRVGDVSGYAGPLKSFLDDINNRKLKSISIDFLGLFDTVSSIGVSSDALNNVDDYGLYLNKDVKAAMQLCASDEYRQNFPLTDLGSAVTKDNISEFFIPGCHTDVGGTYKFGTRTMNIEYKTQVEGEIKNWEYQRYPFKICIPPNSSNAKEISEDLLKRLGWLSGDKIAKDELKIKGNEYQISRSVRRGYNLIPFNLMFKRANKIQEDVFVAPSEAISRFTVPEGLEKYYKLIGRAVKGKMKGRHFLYDGNGSFEYKELRKNYINYSAKPFHAANHPSFKGYVMSRQIIKGDKGSKGSIYLCDYK